MLSIYKCSKYAHVCAMDLHIMLESSLFKDIYPDSTPDLDFCLSNRCVVIESYLWFEIKLLCFLILVLIFLLL